MILQRKIDAGSATVKDRRPHAFHASRRRRRAFSLLEVILALAILLGAIAMLGELIRIGTRSAAAARDLTEAQLLCESVLAEAGASASLPQSVDGAPFDAANPEGDGWLYSIAVESGPDAGLVSVRVTVTQDLPPEERPVEFSLVRWLRDPDVTLSGESQQDQAAGAEEGTP